MEINRIEVISAVVSEMIATLPEERRQKAYIHLFGTAPDGRAYRTAQRC